MKLAIIHYWTIHVYIGRQSTERFIHIRCHSMQLIFRQVNNFIRYTCYENEGTDVQRQCEINQIEVIAWDAAGQSSHDSFSVLYNAPDQITKTSILLKGWNLISISLEPCNPDIEDILQLTDLPANRGYIWRTMGQQLAAVNELHPINGYWVYRL